MTDTAATPVKRIELTARALVLGSLLGVIFTAANVYLGLQVGLTFASAIPAAVISMALLRAFRTSTIWENMTVQTVASVGGAMSSIIFVLPALVMVGWWTNFPFWQSFLICAFGGILGVTFSIPLRRALVINADLPYPEGVAAAEVLKVGSRGADQTEAAVRENKAGLLTVIVGSIASALFAFLVAARVFVGEAADLLPPSRCPGRRRNRHRRRHAARACSAPATSSALPSASPCSSACIIAWAVLRPRHDRLAGRRQAQPKRPPSPSGAIRSASSAPAAIGVAAIWTLLKLIGPLVGGVTSALAAQRKRAANEALDITEQDIPIDARRHHLARRPRRHRRPALDLHPGHAAGRVSAPAHRRRRPALCRRHRLRRRRRSAATWPASSAPPTALSPASASWPSSSPRS